MKARPTLFAMMLFLGSGCLVLAIVYSGCEAMQTGAAVASAPIVLPMMEAANRVDEAREHGKGPIPESEWNNVRLWYRISDSPATYLPRGFPKSRPRTEKTGTWFVDQRDGKRLFVPKGGAGGYSESVLTTEATNATQWRKRENHILKPDSAFHVYGD